MKRASDKPRVALLFIGERANEELVEYMARVGFDVHECDELPVPSSFAALVLIGDFTAALLVRVRTWLRLAKTQRLIVITAKPAALRELVATHGDRLLVLPAPAFGWDVVDALRASRQPPRPSSA